MKNSKSQYGILILITSLIFIGCQPTDQSQEYKKDEIITLSSLLNEMIDRDRLARYPEQRFKLKQQSSYNRASTTPSDDKGWYNNKDYKQFIRIDSANGRKEWVMMDHQGAGAMTRVWMPDETISPMVLSGQKDAPESAGILRVYLDGNPEPILEGSPYDLFNGTQLAPFPFGHQSLSSAVSFLPFPWAKSCKITLSQKPFFYIFTYREYDEGVLVKTLEQADLIGSKQVFESVGQELLNPRSVDAEKNTSASLAPGATVNLNLPDGTRALEMLSVKIDSESSPQLTRSLILKIKFDGKETVWTPIGDFFGTGVGIHPFQGWYRTVEENGMMTCRWVMPYQESAEISLVNLSQEQVEVELSASTKVWEWDEQSMYFHANWNAENDVPTMPRSDWNYITLKGKGVYVGDALTIWNPIERWWGEGDAKIWVDSDTFPSMFGTGTEDYYAYSWGGKNRGFYEHPFHAQVRVDKYDKSYQVQVPVEPNTQGYSTETRTRALDGMPFDSSLQLDMEIWHWKDCLMDYAVGTYWYALPDATSNIVPMPEGAVEPVKVLNKSE